MWSTHETMHILILVVVRALTMQDPITESKIINYILFIIFYWCDSIFIEESGRKTVLLALGRPIRVLTSGRRPYYASSLSQHRKEKRIRIRVRCEPDPTRPCTEKKETRGTDVTPPTPTRRKEIVSSFAPAQGTRPIPHAQHLLARNLVGTQHHPPSPACPHSPSFLLLQLWTPWIHYCNIVK